MSIRVSKPSFNIREKLTELDRPVGVQGTQVMRSNTVEEVFDAVQAGRRNLFNNGDMQVCQRHTDTAVSQSAGGYHMDRYSVKRGSSFAFDTTHQKVKIKHDDVPHTYAYKISCNTATTPSGSHNGGITQIIEGQNCQSLRWGSKFAKPVTLSFWAKAGGKAAGTYSVMMRFWEEDSGNRWHQIKLFELTNEWKKYVMTFTPSKKQEIRTGTDVGLEVYWWLSTGPDDDEEPSTTWQTNTKWVGGFHDNFMADTSNEFYITGCQLEAGTQATPYDYRSFQQELSDCQRYYQEPVEYNKGVNGCFAGRGAGTNQILVSIPLTVPMRSQPATTGTVFSTVYAYLYDSRPNTGGSGTVSLSSAWGHPHNNHVLIMVGGFGSGDIDDDRVVNLGGWGTGSKLVLTAEL